MSAKTSKAPYIPYFERLRDPRWQKRRLEIMARDAFTCLECGNKEKTLNVHHHYYEKGRDPWDYPDDALVTLCEPCHVLVAEEMDGIARVACRTKIIRRQVRAFTLLMYQPEEVSNRGFLPEHHFLILELMRFLKLSIAAGDERWRTDEEMEVLDDGDYDRVTEMESEADAAALSAINCISAVLAKYQEVHT